MAFPASLLLAVSTFVMYVYFSSQAVFEMGMGRGLPRWLLTLLRAQTPVGRRLRPISVSFGIAMGLLSQVVIVLVLTGLPPSDWSSTGVVLILELAAVVLWSMRIVWLWARSSPTRPDT
jgi:hypothetical protein